MSPPDARSAWSFSRHGLRIDPGGLCGRRHARTFRGRSHEERSTSPSDPAGESTPCPRARTTTRRRARAARATGQVGAWRRWRWSPRGRGPVIWTHVSPAIADLRRGARRAAADHRGDGLLAGGHEDGGEHDVTRRRAGSGRAPRRPSPRPRRSARRPCRPAAWRSGADSQTWTGVSRFSRVKSCAHASARRPPRRARRSSGARRVIRMCKLEAGLRPAGLLFPCGVSKRHGRLPSRRGRRGQTTRAPGEVQAQPG